MFTIVRLVNLTILTLIITLNGCLQAPISSRGTHGIITGTPSPTSTATPNPFASSTASDDLFWFTTKKLGYGLAIDYKTADTAYIRGYNVNTFLFQNSNSLKQFCIVSTFNVGGGIKQLRTRAISKTSNDFPNNTEEKRLEVGLSNEEMNRVTCKGTVDGMASNAATVVYKPADICPNCSQNVRSNTLKIYYASTTSAPATGISDSSLVDLAQLNLMPLSLQVNYISDTTNPTNSCTMEYCRAIGQDCCLDGQCVKDGAERTVGVDTTSSYYKQAKKAVEQNYNNFINYPDIFYVCGQRPYPIASPSPSPEGPPDNTTYAQLRVDFLADWYFCLRIAGLNESSPDYSYCQSNFNYDSYDQVVNSVWNLCGCAALGTPAPNDPASKCPTYGLQIVNAAQTPTLPSPTPSHMYGKNLTIPSNSGLINDIYVRGSAVDNFLKKGTPTPVNNGNITEVNGSNLQQRYCLVLNFNKGSSGVNASQLRVSVEPQIKYITTPYVYQRWMRVNLYDYQQNSSMCKGTVNDISGRPVSSDTSNAVVYNANEICSGGCSSQISGLYASFNSTISENTKVTDLNLSTLKMTLNSSSSVQANTTSSGYYWYVKNNDYIGDVACLNYPIPVATGYQSKVYLNTRTAPHRLFLSSSGKEVEDITEYVGTPAGNEIDGTPFAEGSFFYYEDDYNKLHPNTIVNVSDDNQFAFNSIIGQFKADGTGALPAKIVNLPSTSGSYIISVKPGGYTPCTKCARDSWYMGYTAHPGYGNQSAGLGLEALGHTTARGSDEEGQPKNDNITGGNYEDTVWGRACWIPPTMIPFSHKGVDANTSNVIAQRQNRLKTQAAFYMNGYQHDWFGFNYGAVIGSFDGVRWFAIGRGRRVTPTSKKLFLAINAPFADLAQASTFEVQVVAAGDSPDSKFPTVDYDPNIADISNVNQNEAASCQKYHICNTDADCITALGWAYMCADVSPLHTLLPMFDLNTAQEKVTSDDSRAVSYAYGLVVGGIRSVTAGNILGAVGTKRCVYRGAGAPCVVNYGEIADLSVRKLFTCAPNYYCAAINSHAFNFAINREPSNMWDTMIYGQGANVLGRPYTGVDSPGNYVSANEALPAEVVENIKANAKVQGNNGTLDLSSPTYYIGMCRPGKSLLLTTGLGYEAGSVAYSHTAKDPAGRTDYISQIASCDSSQVGMHRMLHTCPLLGDENTSDTSYRNYYYINSPSYPWSFLFKLRAQNACGNESRGPAPNNLPTFSLTEADPLSQNPELTKATGPRLARDACLRRAGSICHSDLDCVPNKLHENEASKIYDQTMFGNTIAEMLYWNESLICGQPNEKLPYNITSDFDRTPYATFKFSDNRCCRESGKELTMFTEGFPYFYGNKDLNANLKTSMFLQPSGYRPGDVGRYSRYVPVGRMGLVSLGLFPYTDNYAETVIITPIPGSPIPAMQPYVIYTPTPNTDSALRAAPYQWKTIHDTAAKTCCSGWIREFAGNNKGHDWTSWGSKLTFNIADFSCINYRNPMVFQRPPNVSEMVYQSESANYCVDRANLGCAHYMQAYPTAPPGNLADKTGIGQSKLTAPIFSFPDNMESGKGDVRLKAALGATNNRQLVLRVHSDPKVRNNYLHDLAPYPPEHVNEQIFENDPLTGPLTHGGAAVVFDTYNFLNNAGNPHAYMYKKLTESGDTNGYMAPSQTHMVLQIPSYINGGQNITRVFLSRRSVANTSNYECLSDQAPTPCAIDDRVTKETLTGTGGIELPRLGNNGICTKIQADSIVPAGFPGKRDVGDGNNGTILNNPFGMCTDNPGGWQDTEGWCYYPSGNQKESGLLFIKRSCCHANTAAQLNTSHASATCQNLLPPQVQNHEFSNYAGVIIEFKPFGSDGHQYDGSTVNPLPTPLNIIPGNDLYYMEKLARFELLGIPQIYYEPLYCSYDRTLLVPSLFNPLLVTANDFATPAFKVNIDQPSLSRTDVTNPNRLVVFKDQVALPDVFSADHFMCCQRLGSRTADPTKCCSGYGQQLNGDPKFTCKLPNSTDLNVYFNRFVSGEGSYTEIPINTRLLDDDFDSQTGYPKITATVISKLQKLAQMYCSTTSTGGGGTTPVGKYVTGGAFGNFGPRPMPAYEYADGSVQPTDNRPWGILERTTDIQAKGTGSDERGYNVFKSGRRWNHHIYCDK